MTVFLNGQFLPEAQAAVSVHDRGFLYGDGLFETIRVVNSRPFRLTQHLERMARGCEHLKIDPTFTPGELAFIVNQLIARNGMPDAVLRMTLSRGPGERGYNPPGETRPTLVMTMSKLPATVGSQALRWSLATSSRRIPANDPLSSFKTLNKLAHVLARMEAMETGADEALLLNANGEVVETAGGNVFWIEDETVCTVLAGQGALPGITQAVILEICEALGLPTQHRTITPSALRRSQGVFLTQSVFGIVPVSRLDHEPIASTPVIDQLQKAYRDLLASI